MIKPSIKACWGTKNPDKLFYIIGFSCEYMGLFAIIKTVLSHIIYAVERGYIPVVNLKDFTNQYIEKGLEGVQNSWELFFLQPADYKLGDIFKSQNIILGKDVSFPTYKYKIFIQLLNKKNKYKLQYFASYYNKYIHFNEETKCYVENELKNILNDNDRTLGVLCRGTDYIQRKPPNHPIQPNPLDVINKAKEIYSQLNYNKIFLATEDKHVYELFKMNFGDILITNKQELYEIPDEIQFLSEITYNNNCDRYMKGLKYLSSIYILSKCNFFIGGRTAGTLGVYFMSNGFEYDYLWDIGYYPT
jgi:hypothetical protein